MGAMNVGQAMPYVEAFSMAKASAATIFRLGLAFYSRIFIIREQFHYSLFANKR